MKTYAIYDVVEHRFVKDLRWQKFCWDGNWVTDPAEAVSNEHKGFMLTRHQEIVNNFRVAIALLKRGTWDWNIKSSDDGRNIASAEEALRRKRAGIPNLGLELAEITVDEDGVASHKVIYVSWYSRLFG